MALRVFSCFTHRTSIDSVWSDAHFSANQFVDALKERPVNGYGHVLVNGTLPRRRIGQENAYEAAQWYGEMAAKILLDHGYGGEWVLVPVPDCKCAIGGSARPRTLTLAKAAALQMSAGTRAIDLLRWDQPIRSASQEGGPRDPSVLYGHLTARGASARR